MSELTKSFKIHDKVIAEPEWQHQGIVGEIIAINASSWYEVLIAGEIYVCHIDDLHKTTKHDEN